MGQDEGSESKRYEAFGEPLISGSKDHLDNTHLMIDTESANLLAGSRFAVLRLVKVAKLTASTYQHLCWIEQRHTVMQSIICPWSQIAESLTATGQLTKVW